MKSKEFALGTLLLTAPFMAACAGPSQSNHWEATGVVSEVDHDHIQLTDIVVISATGSAPERLADGTETVDDNYKNEDCLEKGTTTDLDQLLDEGQIAVGSVVRVAANVGSSQEKCVAGTQGYFEDRSMLQSLIVTS